MLAFSDCYTMNSDMPGLFFRYHQDIILCINTKIVKTVNGCLILPTPC